ncbi:MAG: ABC transporter ATP-binding protein [Candidatus Aenigmarchaeota archaeon]|nr:ABC transporter ATP-binding protein [Candidatus Aenigmarchaeota archaeon]
MNVVEVENFSFSYFGSKKCAVNDVSFTVNKGEFVIITGPSMSGKTTLVYGLSGIIPHLIDGEFKGSINIFGKDTKDVGTKQILKRVGVVLQNPETQLFGMSVEEELRFTMENFGLEESYIQRKVEELLTLFELREYRNKNPMSLSGGQKQKLAIASMISVDPDILILDEPFSNLDFKSKERILRILKMLKARGKTIIMVERSFYDFSELADKIVVLKNSKLLGVFSPNEFFDDERILKESRVFLPVHLFVKEPYSSKVGRWIKRL